MELRHIGRAEPSRAISRHSNGVSLGFLSSALTYRERRSGITGYALVPHRIYTYALSLLILDSFSWFSPTAGARASVHRTSVVGVAVGEDMVAEDEGKKSRILIVGATGNLGHHLASAALRLSHPTFALVRHSAFSDPVKSRTLGALADAGLIILEGSLEDEDSLLDALRRVDAVICALPAKQALDQKALIRSIKKVGSIKRFIPSEFGLDPDKVHISDMDHGFYSRKAEIRRLIEAEGIPYSIISCNFYMSYLLPSLVQPELKAPPRDEVTVFGDGNTRGVFVRESDVAAFTINAVDDPRTLNKVVYLRPPGNIYSLNELIEIWEAKIGKKLRRRYMSEEELLTKIKEIPYPDDMPYVFIYSAFIKGDQTYFGVEASGGLEGTKVYPNLTYTTISEYLDTLV